MSLVDFINYDFLTYSLIATLFLSLVFGLISPFIIAKRYAYMGAAISHSTLLSISITSFIFQVIGAFSAFLSVLIITLIIIAPLAYSSRVKKNLPSDGLIGVYFTATMALGILISNHSPAGSERLMSYLFGNIILITVNDVIITILMALFVVTIIILKFRRWMLFTFDPMGAELAGISVGRYHYLFYFILCLLIVTSIKLAGSILITSFLLLPGIAGLSTARNSKQVFITSIIFSILSAVLGLILANAYDLSAGATMAFVQFISLLALIGLKYLRMK